MTTGSRPAGALWPGPGPWPMYRLRTGPQDLTPQAAVRETNQYIEVIHSGQPSSQYVRETNQYIEVIHSGQPSTLYVRETNQYIEVVTSGDPTAQYVRLTQQYIEVVATYQPFLSGNPGTTKTPPGKINKPPGQGGGKKQLNPNYSLRGRVPVVGGEDEGAYRTWTLIGDAQLYQDQFLYIPPPTDQGRVRRLPRTKVVTTGTTHSVKEM